ncbi:MAG: peptidyl-tRNA hydrolase, PTH1 family [Candidatus Berkelbacteria bacterium Athens1014_28]|uniref:Peptidyl-tRNA hydrolase n=1 Tax=Candidatus Berkelbacteria bacterium Athens1014_28 TaxID=2017145 RepID=A0A554LLL8_9BACT|nr:MAG: peptidyl-tRNA hydrolase, PTH1 family [Candidatus Berkelbacteria bacterium Athens1014_28]
MKLLVGLGNPGKNYQGTRHNVGFDFVDQLVKDKRLAPVDRKIVFTFNKKYNAEIAEVQVAGLRRAQSSREKLIFAKPQTFMNLSGNAVKKIVDFYKIELCDILVVCDDLDLPIGSCRIRHSGSSGGHNGVTDIIEKLGSDQFSRLRIGVAEHIIGSLESDTIQEKPESQIYVLASFQKRERPIVDKIIKSAVEYIVEHFVEGREISATTLEI